MPVELVVLTLVFLWFWQMNNKTGWNFKPTVLDLPIWSFIALASISCIFSIYAHASFFEMKRLLVMAGIYYLVVNNFSRRAIERLVALIVIIGAGISVIGLGQYFFELPHFWWSPKEFLASTYVNHNHFAGYLEMAMPLAVGFFFSGKTLLRKLGFGCAVIVMIIAFIFAQSRGAWISIAVAVFMMTFYLSRKKIIGKYLFLMVAMLLLFAFVIIYAGEDDLARRAGTMTDVKGDASFMTRVMIWQGTVDTIQNNPLIGTGIGTLVWGFPRYRPPGLNHKIVHAHNDYLHMMAEMGLLALPLMVWMIFIVLKKGFSLAAQPIYAGITTGLLSIFIHGLTDFNFHIPANMMLVSALCAFLMTQQKSEKPLDLI